jgi:hypothetical protein
MSTPQAVAPPTASALLVALRDVEGVSQPLHEDVERAPIRSDPQPASARRDEKPKPGREGVTTSKASSGRPPYLVGLVSGSDEGGSAGGRHERAHQLRLWGRDTAVGAAAPRLARSSSSRIRLSIRCLNSSGSSYDRGTSFMARR